MLAISIADRPQEASGCIKCCCEMIQLKPGETQPLVLNYAPWAVPIAGRGLHCTPVVEIEEKETCPTAPAGPVSSDDPIAFDVVLNTASNIDLATVITSPESRPLTFKHLTLYGPMRGSLKQEVAGVTDGKFTYTPQQNYSGPDRFFVSVSDGVEKPRVFEVLIGVGVSGNTVVPTPDLSVGLPVIDQRFYIVRLPVTASPAAQTCQVFRMSIRQGAMDCDYLCYYHVDCVDVRIAQC